MHSKYHVYHIYILLYFQDVLLQLPHRYGHYTLENAKRWKLYIAKQHHPFENSTNNWGYPFLDIGFYSYKHKGMVIQDIDRSRHLKFEVQGTKCVSRDTKTILSSISCCSSRYSRSSEWTV